MGPTVGLVVDLEHHCGRDVLRGVCRIGHQLGWQLVFARLPWIDGGADPFLRPFDGVIGYLNPLETRQLGIPHVDLEYGAGQPPPPILFDEEDIGRCAARHLLDQGLHHLAVVAGTTTMHPVSMQRLAGFRQVAVAAGVPCLEFYPTDGPSPKLLRQLTPWLAALPAPCGVFGISDYYANLVLTACHDSGLPVPGRISVVGADNDEIICLLAAVPLSSVAVPHEERGAAAALRLQALLAGRDPGPPVVLPPGPVIVRASTGLLAGSDPILAKVAHFIHTNLTASLTVGRIAAGVGLNRRALERHFRNVLRRSIHDELRRIRTQRGMELLATSDLPVSAIALSMGLSHNAFTSAFQAVAGQTPTAWRRARRVRLIGYGPPLEATRMLQTRPQRRRQDTPALPAAARTARTVAPPASKRRRQP